MGEDTHSLATVGHKKRVNLQAFNGAAIVSRTGQLAGGGKGMRHLTCRFGEAIDAAFEQAFGACACIANLTERVATDVPPRPSKQRPLDLAVPV